MINLEFTRVYGFESAIRGMRNPMNSWDKSDSVSGLGSYFTIGKNDYELAKKLILAGTDHSKFLRTIVVWVDITAPLYWWKEFDTYKVGTVANSCSTMHKIMDKPFEVDDFSHEQLSKNKILDSKGREVPASLEILETICNVLNAYREDYLLTHGKQSWYTVIQLLPSSYNQKRTVMLNYQVLSNIYNSRKNHKLYEWSSFCNWIELLPYSSLITTRFDDDDNPDYHFSELLDANLERYEKNDD